MVWLQRAREEVAFHYQFSGRSEDHWIKWMECVDADIVDLEEYEKTVSLEVASDAQKVLVEQAFEERQLWKSLGPRLTVRVMKS